MSNYLLFTNPGESSTDEITRKQVINVMRGPGSAKQGNFKKKVSYASQGLYMTFFSDGSVKFAYFVAIFFSVLAIVFGSSIMAKIIGVIVAVQFIMYESSNTISEALIDRGNKYQCKKYFICNNFDEYGKFVKDGAASISMIHFCLIMSTFAAIFAKTAHDYKRVWKKGNFGKFILWTFTR